MEKQVKLHNERRQLNSAVKAGSALTIFAGVYVAVLLSPGQTPLER